MSRPSRRALLASAALALPLARAHGSGLALGPLLARNREKHPGPRNSNHLSMALLSLAAVGAREQHLVKVAEPRLARMRAFPTGGPTVTADNWRRFRGDARALPGLHALFAREVASRGVAATLRATLPDLVPGLGAHAFHALIRTGYGVRFEAPAEVAMGLAYWAVTYLPLGPLADPPLRARSDPAAALALVRARPSLTPAGRARAGIVRPDGLNIAEAMAWVATLPDFSAVAGALRIDEASLDAIATAVVRLHVASNDDFTALHGVTGTHAYRLVEPYLGDRLAGRRCLWQALVAAYVTIGAPALEVPPPGALPTWKAVLARAAVSDDDHEIKLADVAHEEFRRSQDLTYLRAAALRLGMA